MPFDSLGFKKKIFILPFPWFPLRRGIWVFHACFCWHKLLRICAVPCLLLCPHQPCVHPNHTTYFLLQLHWLYQTTGWLKQISSSGTGSPWQLQLGVHVCNCSAVCQFLLDLLKAMHVCSFPRFPASGCWNGDIPVPWNDQCALVAMGSWSMLSTADFVNMSMLSVGGHTV